MRTVHFVWHIVCVGSNLHNNRGSFHLELEKGRLGAVKFLIQRPMLGKQDSLFDSNVKWPFCSSQVTSTFNYMWQGKPAGFNVKIHSKNVKVVSLLLDFIGKPQRQNISQCEIAYWKLRPPFSSLRWLFSQSWQLNIELLIFSQLHCQKYLLSTTSFLVSPRGVIDNIKKGTFQRFIWV